MADKPRAKPYRAQWREHPNQPDSPGRYFKTKREADAFLVKTLADLNAGTYVSEADGRITFREYAEAGRKDQDHAQGTPRPWSRTCISMCTRCSEITRWAPSTPATSRT